MALSKESSDGGSTPPASTNAKNSNRQDSGRQATVPVESGIHFNTEGMKMLIVLHLTLQCKCGNIALQWMEGKKEIMTCRVN